VQRRAELALIRRMLAHLDAGTTDEAPAPLRLPPAHHTSTAHLALERRALFRTQPIAAALSADLPEAGSFLAVESGGIPILLVRGGDRRIRAFLNVCRHRGAPVAEGRGTAAGGRLRCPFHAWTYDLSGDLAAIPLGEAGYAGCARSALGLRALPCLERAGLVLVRPEGDLPIDAETWLGEVALDLEALGLERFHFFAEHRGRWQANWKLLLETFLESYHVFSLHRETVHPHYFSLPMVADPIGPQLRFPVARRTLAELRDQPEASWQLVAHATVQWYLAPNALLSATRDYALLWRFESPEPDVCRVDTRFYTARPVVNEAEEKRWRDAFALQLRVTGEEDFPMQEKIQRGLASGAAADLVIGTHEIGVVHLHATLAKLLAEAPR
jgi:phenylpropionate dioxygenase-like ring-hydroxylating dioxygenase large terminal subunit